MSRNWMRIAILAVISCLCIKYSDTVLAAALLVLQVLQPLMVGFGLAYVMNILMKQLEKIYFPKKTERWVQKTRRPVCVAGSVLLVFVVVFLVFVMVIPALSDSVATLANDIPKAFARFQRWLVRVAQDSGYEGIEDMANALQVNWQDIYNKAGEVLSMGVTSLFSVTFTAASQMMSFLYNGVISLIFAIYLLFQKETLCRQLRMFSDAYLPESWVQRTGGFLALAHETFTSFISGQVLEAVILGSLCGVGMALIGLPYAVLTGTVVGVTALIPVMGAYIGSIVGAFLILTVSPMKAVIFLIYLVILQQIEGNVIYPRVVGSSIGLPGIWVLASITVGGGLLGVPGMLLGVPLSATLYKWMRINVQRRLKNNVRPSEPRLFRKEKTGAADAGKD